MINIGNILKRSWHILWNYRILWIFGILLALTAGGLNPSPRGNGSSQSGGRPTNNIPQVLPENAPQWSRDFNDWGQELNQWFEQNVEPVFTHPGQYIGTIILVVVLFLLLILLIGALVALIRYPTETAVMRMVDEYEHSGSKIGFRQGWKLGWSRRAFRIWLIDLILALPALVFVLLLISAGLIIYFSVSSTFKVTSVIGIVAAIGIIFLSFFLIIVVAVFLSLLRNFFVRFAALEDLRVRESLRRGWAMFKQNWKSAGLMWLVMIGIGIGIGIVGMILFLLLIPAYLVLLLPAVLVAALPALIAFGISSIFTHWLPALIIALLVAVPFFVITMFAPMILFAGWYKIYESNVWTLTYREIKALESLEAPELPLESDKPAES